MIKSFSYAGKVCILQYHALSYKFEHNVDEASVKLIRVVEESLAVQVHHYCKDLDLCRGVAVLQVIQ